VAIWTPSKQGKPKLRSAAASLMSILDASSLAIVAVSPDGYFAYGNDTTEQLLGYDENELTAYHLNDVLNAEPDWINAQLASLGQGGPWSGNVSLKRRDGESVAFAVNAFSTGTDVGPAYIGLLHTPLPNDAHSERLEPSQAFSLGSRELCAILLMCEGFADKEIASLLGTSVWTVNKEVGRVLRKMNANSRTEACIKAIRHNLIL
jgi:PAS domain S-box-containing protein